MAGHLIYHWKHGWIPLTHAAALSKAKGNSKLADKFVPGASSHHRDMHTAGLSARAIHGTLTPHERHHSPAADVAKLRHGDQATVHGMDEHGQPMSFTGQVSGVPTPVRIKQGSGGKVEHHFAVSMHNGSEGSNGIDAMARTTVYVKNPDGVSVAPPSDVQRVQVGITQANHRAFGNSVAGTAQQTGGGYREGQRVEHEVTNFAKPGYPKEWQAGTVEKITKRPDGLTELTVRHDDGSAAVELVGKRGGNRTVRSLTTEPGHVADHRAVTAQQLAHDRVRAAAAARSADAAKPADAGRGRMNHAAPPTAVSALFDRSRMTPAQEREHVRNVQGQLDAARAARTSPAEDAASKTDAELEVMAKRSPLPAYREAARAELDRRQSTSTGSTPDVSKRVQVDHSGDGTTLEIDRTDTQAREAVKAAGFRWSSNLGAWYLPRTYSEPTRRQKVEQVTKALGEHNVHVNDGGRGATTTAAEREAATRAAAADRAVRMDARAQRAATEADVRFGRAQAIGDMIPMGQPILVGHHSEGRHRRDLAKIDNNMRKGVEAHRESQAAAHAADNARRTAEGDSPLMRQRRIDRNEAEARKIDRRLQEHRIATKAPEKAARVGIHPLSADYHDQLTTRRAELADQIAHDKAQIEASGHKTVSTADVSQGDLVQYRGQWHIAKKVNKTTVSVPTGYSWDDKVPANQITGHKKLVDLPESALRSGAANGSLDPKLRAAYVRELNRRGIHLGSAS